MTIKIHTMSLSTVDIILLICFIPAIISGIRNGFIRQAAGLLALIIGVWIGYKFSYIVGDQLNKWFEMRSSWTHLISFTILFIGVMLLVSLVGRLAEKIVKFAFLGWVNKILGVAFALITTALILSILIYIITTIDESLKILPKLELAKSDIYTFLKGLAPRIFPYFKGL